MRKEVYSATGNRVVISLFCVILLATVFAMWKSQTRAYRSDDPETVTQTFSSAPAASMPPGITYTFHNPTPVVFPVPQTIAAPYPSSINVTNLPPQVAKITVTLRQMDHTFVSDIDIMLVGPQGQTAIIMSDVGGGTDLTNTTITLDDEAATTIPALGPIPPGTYRPTNGTNGTPDPFPSPAPVPTTDNAQLSVFNGTNPNGEWRLFVMDDVSQFDGGSLAGGWTLNITSAISGQNTGPIDIADNGTANPYPSQIDIADHNNPVSKVRVSLLNFSHSSPDDVDILLVSPSGRSVVLMSDAGGGSPVTNLNISFDDAATNFLPNDGPLTTGDFKPTDFDPGDAFPAPAPAAPPAGRMLSSLYGTPANGAWRLFVVDDAGNNVGNVSGGWNLLVGNTAGTITFQSGSIATPYPSEVQVTGLAGNITRATVTLQNFSHTSPGDLDIMLVAPDNRRIVLLSDAGGTHEVGELNLTFDDQAGLPPPLTTPLFSGTWRPGDHEPGEVFPAPAPSGPPTGTTLGAFYGGLPNGIWKLYAVNEAGQSVGSIAGPWSLTLTASTSACLINVSPTVQAFPVAGGSSAFSVGQPNGCAWTATAVDPFITITSGTSGGGNGTVAFTVAANEGPARTGLIEVSNGFAVRSFQVQQASGCPFAVSQTAMSFGPTGGNANVEVTAGSVCSWQGATNASWIQISSQPQSGNGTLAFTVRPNTLRASRSTTVDVGRYAISVNQSGVRSAPFDFDGDSRTDVSIYRPSTGVWWIQRSTAGTFAQQFGLSTDRVAAADYDGDLKSDLAVYRDGVWYLLKSSDATVLINNWGTSGDVPVAADYSGDGAAELAVWRPSTGVWWILNSNGSHTATAFGIPTDAATPADYDGDGRADISVYRGGQSGTWWILRSANGAVLNHPFGIDGDLPVPADYDGDGRDNVAVFRPSTGVWYRSLDPSRNYDAVQFGLSGDRPVPGDYDGDGRADPAVVRFGSTAVWYVLGSTAGASSLQFGLNGDVPVPAR